MLKSFYAQAGLLFVLFTIWVFAGGAMLGEELVHFNSLYANIYLFLLSLLSYYIVARNEPEDGFVLNNRIMGSITIRLLLSGAVLIGYYYAVGEGNISFTGNFFLFYLFYTWFEIRALLSNLRANSRK